MTFPRSRPAAVLSFCFFSTIAACSSSDGASSADDASVDGSSVDTAPDPKADGSADTSPGDALPSDGRVDETSLGDASADASGDVAKDATDPACGKTGQPCCTGKKCDAGLGCDSFKTTCAACTSNYCVDHGLTSGWHCDAATGKEVQCGLDSFSGCATAYAQKCATGVTCSAATGTCGGCDPTDQCFEMKEGLKICVPGTGKPTGGVCTKQPDGCVTTTGAVECASKTCFFGSGCCGGLGDSCCKGVTPSCRAGSCNAAGTCE